jgi:hypothetical protein
LPRCRSPWAEAGLYFLLFLVVLVFGKATAASLYGAF